MDYFYYYYSVTLAIIYTSVTSVTLDSSDRPTTRQHSLMAQVFMANVHYGLVKDVQCWSLELCAGLALVQPDTDWKAHMLLLKPIDHKLVAQFARHAFCNHLQCYTCNTR